MRSNLIHTSSKIIMALLVVSLFFVSCCDDSNCPTCPQNNPEWVEYDNFDDNSLDTLLWNYIEDCCGGQVLETAEQLQVWGNTGGWTGTGIVRTVQPKMAWSFDLVETYSEDTPNGCQGWHIYAYSPDSNSYLELLNDVNSGCSVSYEMGGEVGTYEIMHEDDSIAVYLGKVLVHRVFDNGIDLFSLHFTSDNMHGDGTHSHIFVDNVWSLE